MANTWKLKRLSQCKKCPWRKDTDPDTIPDGYSRELHRALESTIAQQGYLTKEYIAMACHEHPVGEEAHCIGWLWNQLGPGNNIALRLHLMACTNADQIQLDGDQHLTFEGTLPKGEP